MPRRLMLILSSLGISAALIGMGCYFLFKDWEKWDCQKLNNHTEIEVSLPTSKHCHNYNNNSDFLMENCPPTYTESIGKVFHQIQISKYAVHSSNIVLIFECSNCRI